MSDEKIEYLFSNLKDFMIGKFNQLDEKFEKRFDKHEEQQRIDLENLEKRIEKRFDEHEEKQRLDFARLEHVMYERTAALFDAREVSLDEDKNLYKKRILYYI